MLRSFILSAFVSVAMAGASYAQAPAAATFKPTHVTVNAGGTGPDVILIPGLGSSRSAWEKEVPKLLAAHYRLHLVQIDGFAGTAPGANAGMKSGMLEAIVNDLDKYIQANGLKSPAVIGHSLGGLVGLMLAEQHPGDVGKLVIVDSLPFFSRLMDKDTPEEAHDGAIQTRNQLSEASKQDWLKQSIAGGEDMATEKDNQQKIALWTANSDQKVFAEAFYEDEMTDARPELSKVTIPILVLWPYTADKGKEADVEKRYVMQWGKAPNAKLVKVDNSKHFIMLDQPEVFDREVEAFLKS